MRPAGIGWITELRRFDWRSGHCRPDELPGGGGLEGSRRGEHDCVCVPLADQLQADWQTVSREAVWDARRGLTGARTRSTTVQATRSSTSQIA